MPREGYVYKTIWKEICMFFMNLNSWIHPYFEQTVLKYTFMHHINTKLTLLELHILN